MSTPSPAVSKVQKIWSTAPHVPEYINSVAVSGDGSVVAAGTFCHAYSGKPGEPQGCSENGEFGTYFWNAQGQELWAPDTFNGWQGVYWVAVSRDGSCIASTGWAAGSPNYAGFINAYDVATKTRTLAYSISGQNGRGNMVAFSQDGTTLVAAADQLYVFTWNGTKWEGPATVAVASGDYVVSVGVSGDGTMIVASTASSKIILVNNNKGTLGTAFTVSVPNATIHNVAMAANGAAFGVAATVTDQSTNSNSGYLFYFATTGFNDQSTPQWQFNLNGTVNCRAVAISDDATLVSGAGSLTEPNESYLGEAVLVETDGSTASLQWDRYTVRDPNSTSMDAAGRYVTVADGYPDATPTQPSPGHFYLYDRMGVPRWTHQTDNMNWPCPISANGNAIVGGSDNGHVYYFSHTP